MSIVASEILEDSLHNPIRRELRYKLTDHVGKEYLTRKIVDSAAFDEVADLAAVAVRYEIGLDEQEQSQAHDRVLAGEDSLLVVQNPIHSTDKKLAKKLIRWMMRAGKSDDPETRQLAATIIIGMEPLLLHLNSNFTDGQLTNFLDITQAQLNRMRQRVNKILNAGATSPKDEMVAVADSAEEWD